MVNHLILSRYEEPQLNKLDEFINKSGWNTVIYCKSERCRRPFELTHRNKGYEASTYLEYLLNPTIPILNDDVVVFSQYCDRTKWRIQEWPIECSASELIEWMAQQALIHGCSCELMWIFYGQWWPDKWATEMSTRLSIPLRRSLACPQSACFAVRGDMLNRIPKERLRSMLDILYQSNNDKRDAVLFELAWFYLLGVEMVMPKCIAEVTKGNKHSPLMSVSTIGNSKLLGRGTRYECTKLNLTNGMRRTLYPNKSIEHETFNISGPVSVDYVLNK
jgi:hypothetical protein